MWFKEIVEIRKEKTLQCTARGTTDSVYKGYDLHHFSDWNQFKIILAEKDDPSYRLNTLGPFCLWQCYSIRLYCMVLHGIWLYLIVLHGVALAPWIRARRRVKTGFRRKTGRSRAVCESIRKIPTGKITKVLVASQPLIWFFPPKARNGPFCPFFGP